MSRLESLSVIVLTRGRAALLRQAMSCLAQQACDLTVIVVIDECPETYALVHDLRPHGAIVDLRIHRESRHDGERSGPRRVAKLRSVGLGLVDTDRVAFLDDDNLLSPDHFSSLHETMDHHASPAAHSWRTLWTRDGAPFRLTGLHPWSKDDDAAAAHFDRYERLGIYTRGSHLVRDQVIPRNRAASMVDTSEWMFETDFLRRLDFELAYSFDDWRDARAEDSKLLDQIVRLGTPIPATGRPTLKYVLGGYSNTPSADGSRLEDWLGVA